MSKVSKDSAATVEDIGVGEVHEDVVDGYEISFLDVREAADLAPLLTGLPGDRCPCPHWGYVTDGELTFTFADHVEIFRRGDAFYTPPGHTPRVAAGTSWVMFSPAEEVARVNEVITRNMARQGA
ncbi:hypothetical protein [Actinomycetospora straminea]|uniref:Cupin domain-containing protein n=1 Tax=Actinomycetospora straminea TaxID=663607 RepID=A0ABP9EWV9_9PSEU|nr:hypothetical protein [Actinomycetospora straminea]MDD7933634.1 hypothetical protein [Actinomycetospora straminea]